MGTFLGFLSSLVVSVLLGYLLGLATSYKYYQKELDEQNKIQLQSKLDKEKSLAECNIALAKLYKELGDK